MKTVDLYHLVGIAALLLLTLCVTLGANDGVVFMIGIGIIVILLLGVHLVLDKQDKRLCVIEKKLEDVYYDVHFTKKQSEFGAGIKLKEQSEIIESLANISLMINERKVERKSLSTDEIKRLLEDLKMKVEEISVNNEKKQ